MLHPNAFPKAKRLCSKYLIDNLFEQGTNKSLVAFPCRLVYKLKQGTGNTQLLISVSKRHFKHAVDRNRIKRQVREAYRTNYNILQLPKDTYALIAILWLDDYHRNSDIVTAKVKNLLQRMNENINCNENN